MTYFLMGFLFTFGVMAAVAIVAVGMLVVLVLAQMLVSSVYRCFHYVSARSTRAA